MSICLYECNCGYPLDALENPLWLVYLKQHYFSYDASITLYL